MWTLLPSLSPWDIKQSPPKDFGVTKRNIHFVAACRQVAKQRLSSDLLQLLGPVLPDNEGMVRISASPPNQCAQRELPYDDRFFDVPAARTAGKSAPEPPPPLNSGSPEIPEQTAFSPLVVPLDKQFSPSGHGVVSQRTANHVGFNGLQFRGSNGYPELRNTSSRLV